MRKKIIFSTLTILLLSILLNTVVAPAQPSVPTIYDAIDDIEERIDHGGIANSLISKLENALKALENGNYKTFTNILNAFINNVEAQSGKKIDEDYADTLIGWAHAWIEEPESALEISIYYSGSIMYIIYNLNDPDNLGYHFTAWVDVYSSDGVGDIASVTMITPEGDPVEMYYEGPAEEPGLSRYYADIDLDGPMLGFYGFAAEDGDGNTAEFEYEISTWIDSIPTYVAPPVGEVFPSSDSLFWEITFDSEAPSFDAYWLGLWDDSGFFWMIETPDMPIDFSGEPLEDGDYGWSLYCMTPDLEAEVLVQGSFTIDSEAPP